MKKNFRPLVKNNEFFAENEFCNSTSMWKDKK
jgi:hypothetical protein